MERGRAVQATAAHREHDLAPLGELDRVREQVQEHLAQAGHVTDDRGRGAVADQVREVQALLGGPRGHEVERALDALPQVERLGLELELPRLDLGEVEDVVDDGQERVAALTDDLRELALLVGQRGVQEEPAHPDHGVQRGPDLVAHRRQEGALGLVGRLGLPAGPEELGDVVIDPDHADLGAVDDHGHGRELDVHQRAVLPGAPRDRADPLALERPPDVGADLLAGLRGRHEVLHAAAEGLRRRVPEEALGAGVPAHDLAVEVHGRDRHRARLHERVRVLLLALDLPEEARRCAWPAPTGRRRSGVWRRPRAEKAPRSRRMMTRPPSSRSSRTSGTARSERMPSRDQKRPHLGGDQLRSRLRCRRPGRAPGSHRRDPWRPRRAGGAPPAGPQVAPA